MSANGNEVADLVTEIRVGLETALAFLYTYKYMYIVYMWDMK